MKAWIAVLAALAPLPAMAQTFPSSAGALGIETVARGLDHPWALAFLPDGRMLITERPGRLNIATRDGKLARIAGVPPVRAAGQGGLHDIPAWKGNLFVGALAGQMLVRLELEDEKVVKEERLLATMNERIRDVRQGPDGAIWLLTDSQNGKLLRMTPAK
jgi:glucose/arabinose dehydrogenase